jgi:hypothetical protein
VAERTTIWRQFPRSFWSANAMEIFERMGWYGFYAGRIAPPDKVGMYMGYFYWCVALGTLVGGLLSGVAYQHFGPKRCRPTRPDVDSVCGARLDDRHHARCV